MDNIFSGVHTAVVPDRTHVCVRRHVLLGTVFLTLASSQTLTSSSDATRTEDIEFRGPWSVNSNNRLRRGADLSLRTFPSYALLSLQSQTSLTTSLVLPLKECPLNLIDLPLCYCNRWKVAPHPSPRRLATRRPWPLFPFMRLQMFCFSTDRPVPIVLSTPGLQRACPFAIVSGDAFPRPQPWPSWPCFTERLNATVFKRAGWTAKVSNCPSHNFTLFTDHVCLSHRTLCPSE